MDGVRRERPRTGAQPVRPGRGRARATPSGRGGRVMTSTPRRARGAHRRSPRPDPPRRPGTWRNVAGHRAGRWAVPSASVIVRSHPHPAVRAPPDSNGRAGAPEEGEVTALALAGNGPGAEPESLIMFGSLRPQEPPHAQGRRLAAHGRATSPRSRLTPRDAASLPTGALRAPGAASRPVRCHGRASRARVDDVPLRANAPARGLTATNPDEHAAAPLRRRM